MHSVAGHQSQIGHVPKDCTSRDIQDDRRRPRRAIHSVAGHAHKSAHEEACLTATNKAHGQQAHNCKKAWDMVMSWQACLPQNMHTRAGKIDLRAPAAAMLARIRRGMRMHPQV